jgi:hypothetical protein
VALLLDAHLLVLAPHRWLHHTVVVLAHRLHPQPHRLARQLLRFNLVASQASRLGALGGRRKRHVTVSLPLLL